jgi:hypothetical protein
VSAKTAVHRGGVGHSDDTKGQVGAVAAVLRQHAYFGTEPPSVRTLGPYFYRCAPSLEIISHCTVFYSNNKTASTGLSAAKTISRIELQGKKRKPQLQSKRKKKTFANILQGKFATGHR